MKKSAKWVVALLVLAMFLSACTEKEEVYTGKELVIGVVGDVPDIQNEHITFKEIPINELTKETAKATDAVFIMGDQLEKASEEKYVKLYKEAHVPFFFMESKMGIVPFLEAGLLYEEGNFENRENLDYAYGFEMTEENNMNNWSVGLKNDTTDENSVTDVYTRIFTILGEVTEKPKETE